MIVNMESFDFEKMNSNTVSIMNYLNDYLENEWKIKKKQNFYIISNHCSKIYTLDSLQVNGTAISDSKQKYILAFIYNGLNNGWTIKKSNNQYTFYKNHEGKKEVFLDNYLKQFIGENLELNDILQKK